MIRAAALRPFLRVKILDNMAPFMLNSNLDTADRVLKGLSFTCRQSRIGGAHSSAGRAAGS